MVGRRLLRVLVVLVLGLGSLLLWVAAAGAVVHAKPHARRPGVRSNTELVWHGTFGPGGSVQGFIADSASLFNPATAAYPSYPAGSPPAGFSVQNEGFAGIVVGDPTDNSPPVSLYCIDIRTITYPGYGYGLGTWGRANVPLVGYVARILDEYYPHTNEPAGLSVDQKATAVQAAIWYFTDLYVLNTSDPLHDAVAAIVSTIQDKGPIVEPPPPSLSLAPPQLSGPAGSVLGPFTLTLNNRGRRAHRRHRGVTDATVTATGATMFSDASGMTQLGDGSTATVPSGQAIYLRSSGPSTAVLQATAKATVPTGW